MEHGSSPNLPASPRPTSSVYSDDLSTMAFLIRKLSEETRAQEYETIATYMREIQALEEELVLYRRTWNGTIMLANEVIKAVTVIKRYLIKVNTEMANAEREWLAFWGIYQESQGIHPPWI